MQVAELLGRLDPRPDIRGRQFERICAWYLSNAPEYRERIQRVWLWSEWPGAWAADAGIDLVAEEHEGSLWAVQAKAYDPAYAIRKSDVDSFLSESSRPEFSYRLLIATTDRLGPTARRTLDGQREPVGYVLRSQLELSQVSWPMSLADLRPKRLPRKRPRPHSREAIRAVLQGFESDQRGQLIMACGTGKTLTAMWIAERFAARRVLVLVPSLSLLAQTLREWSANAADPFKYLAVCSDQTVVGKDEFVQHTAELGFPVTTNACEIAAFLRRRGRRVVFATYQSSPQIAAACALRATPQFDLAIADEAHRCAGRASTEFATILHEEAIKSRRRLFMTATPRFYTNRLRHEAGLADLELASMDDPELFGPVFHRLTFGEAIKLDLLSDYQVAVVGVSNKTYREWAESGLYVTRDGRKITDARTLAGQVALSKAIRKYGLRRIISFHGRVKAAADFSRELPDVISWLPDQVRPRGRLWSQHVAGTMTSGHRDRLLLRFRNAFDGEIALLSNARCLAEGVDVPTLDGIAFIDPRRSTTDIVQAVGRAIRKAPEKSVGTIVLPVFISDDEPERALQSSTFQHVWDVLKALRAHDESLGDELDELRQELGARRSLPRRPGKIKLDLPREVGSAFAAAFDVRLVERTTSTWEFWFGLLRRYVEYHGTAAELPSRAEIDGYKLGSWVIEQRAAYERGRLKPEYIVRLTAIPGWSWRKKIHPGWDFWFALVTRYAKQHGTVATLTNRTEIEGYKVGQWLHTQRRDRTMGRLTAARAARLEQLPGWLWDRHGTNWERMFALLEQYVEREGHAAVPDTHYEDGYWLGRWVTNQRMMHSGRRREKISPARVAKLEALTGWTWDRRQSKWDRHFAAVVKFADREGDARVPFGYVEGDIALGAWVARQRAAYRVGKVPADRIARLESVRGWEWRPPRGAAAQKLSKRNLRAIGDGGPANRPHRTSQPTG